MQKKMLAVAVAGALGAPAVAMAQTSTVQIFGTVYMEYAFIGAYDGASVPTFVNGNAFSASGNTVTGLGAGGGRRKSTDILQSPGSELGFKGEEQLGGGLSAWFQCASTMDIRGSGVQGICSRNSALGMKGPFGNVFIGIWDSPFKRTISPTAVGSNDTGVFGSAFLLTGGSTSTTDDQSRSTFKRRQTNSIFYDSPVFGGFQVMGAYSATNGGTADTSGQSNAKPRIWSVGAQYSGGPLYIGAGYEHHQNFGSSFVNTPGSQFGVATDFGGPGVVPTNPGGGALGAGTTCANINGPGGFLLPAVGTPGCQVNINGSDTRDWGWHAGAAYTWGPVKFGGQYTRQKFEVLKNSEIGIPDADARYTSWHVGVDWTVIGAHGLRAGYTRTNDAKGNTTIISPAPVATSAGVPGGRTGGGGFGIGSPGGTVANNTLFLGTYRPAPCYAPNPAAAVSCDETGAQLYQIRYVYAFSKRTEFNLGYVHLKNDDNAAYTLGGLQAIANGENQSAWALTLRHTF